MPPKKKRPNVSGQKSRFVETMNHHESRCSFDIEFQNGLMSGRDVCHGQGGNIPQHLPPAVFDDNLFGELIGIRYCCSSR